MKITVLRHAEYDMVTDSITEAGRTAAVDKGKQLVKELGINDSVGKVMLLSSTASRAFETTESIREGLGIPDVEIRVSSDLHDEVGNANDSVAYMRSVSGSVHYIIVVTHAKLVVPILRGLGHPGNIKYPEYLEGGNVDILRNTPIR